MAWRASVKKVFYGATVYLSSVQSQSVIYEGQIPPKEDCIESVSEEYVFLVFAIGSIVMCFAAGLLWL